MTAERRGHPESQSPDPTSPRRHPAAPGSCGSTQDVSTRGRLANAGADAGLQNHWRTGEVCLAILPYGSSNRQVPPRMIGYPDRRRGIQAGAAARQPPRPRPGYTGPSAGPLRPRASLVNESRAPSLGTRGPGQALASNSSAPSSSPAASGRGAAMGGVRKGSSKHSRMAWVASGTETVLVGRPALRRAWASHPRGPGGSVAGGRRLSQSMFASATWTNVPCSPSSERPSREPSRK